MPKLIAVTLTTLLLISCSRLKIALSWADNFALAAAEDYYDLTSAQKAQFKQEFKTILKEVEKNDFPGFANHLNELAELAEKNNFTKSIIEGHFEKTGKLFRSAFIKFEPLIQRINDDQASTEFESFDREYKKKLKKDLDEISVPKKLQRKSRKSYDFWIDLTVGHLTTSQKESLKIHLSENPPPKQLQIESRKAVYEKFVAVRNNAPERREYISKFINDWESMQTEAYIKARKQYQEKLLDWIIQFAQSLTNEQKENLIKNLRKRSLEIRTLSETAA